MPLFQELSDQETEFMQSLRKLRKLLKRKQLRYIAMQSRLTILIAVRKNIPVDSRNYASQIAQNLQDQATAYKRIAQCQGAIRWLQNVVGQVQGAEG